MTDVNEPPTAAIAAPADGSSVPERQSVSFSGTATDAEEGDLTASLTWTSSLDDTIGTGGSFSTSTLSVGTHTITAQVTDSLGESGWDQITLTVTATPGIVQVLRPSGSDGYSTEGGGAGDKHLVVTVTLVDDTGAPVEGATVSATTSGPKAGGGTGTTDALGQVTFKITNAPPGTYTTTVTAVTTATGLIWDGTTPPNSFDK